jgi:hypothetical protein
MFTHCFLSNEMQRVTFTVCIPPLYLKSMRYQSFNIFTILYRATEYIRVRQILSALSTEHLDFLASAQIFSTVTSFCVISSFHRGVNDAPVLLGRYAALIST